MVSNLFILINDVAVKGEDSLHVHCHFEVLDYHDFLCSIFDWTVGR